MVYLKIADSDGNVLRVEALENPVYVYVQPGNGRILRCAGEKAQGILNDQGTEIYQLSEKTPVPGAVAPAEKITYAEYEYLCATLAMPEQDPEDEIPQTPENEDSGQIMTRAELTEKVLELDEAIALLLSGVTE